MTDTPYNIVTVNYRDMLALAMRTKFDDSICAVIALCEISLATEPLLRAELGFKEPINPDGSDGFWVGYANIDAAEADIDKWESEGLISSDDIIDVWVRGADGTFVLQD